jgi:hypothetical protein
MHLLRSIPRWPGNDPNSVQSGVNTMKKWVARLASPLSKLARNHWPTVVFVRKH